MSRSLVAKVKEALEQVDNGDPLKDFLEDDEIIEALRMLVKLEQEPARPDILEKLSYHALERNDLTLDNCLTYLQTNGWHKVRGRTERELLLQITSLLAGRVGLGQETPDD